MLKMSLEVHALEKYVLQMCANYFPDGYIPDYDVTPSLKRALDRIEYCFSKIHRKYFYHDGVVHFNHLNSDHMCTFLYLLGNTIWKDTGESILPEKLFYLNKALNGIDLFYSVELPEIFMLMHPVGTVLGNAKYSDYLVVHQCCTVGAVDARPGMYPVFGKGVVLCSRSSVIGSCNIGENVMMAAASQVIRTDISSDSVVSGHTPNLKIAKNKYGYKERWFDELVL